VIEVRRLHEEAINRRADLLKRRIARAAGVYPSEVTPPRAFLAERAGLVIPCRIENRPPTYCCVLRRDLGVTKEPQKRHQRAQLQCGLLGLAKGLFGCSTEYDIRSRGDALRSGPGRIL
jgi:hypothetical protein